MGFKSTIVKPFAYFITKKAFADNLNGIQVQEKVFKELLRVGRDTSFGKDHHFNDINSIEEYQQAVPVRDYEGIKNYVDLIREGGENILWKGRPIYFAKTSGTTSGAKYIPISKESIHNHIDTARNALFANIAQNSKASFFSGNAIFLSGSPKLKEENGIPCGRLSGIVNHHIPAVLKTSQLPCYETNCIEDWEAKLVKIVQETKDKDLRLIGGIPPWIKMYFEYLINETGKKTIKEIFPNLEIIVHGGINFDPYKNQLHDLIGEKVDFVETYPASEGFIAYQDAQNKSDLLLNINSGIFFEFISAEESLSKNPTRLTLKEVELNKNYAIVLTTNAGLWSYLLGDTVKFVSLKPYRIKVTGRISHFISAFGEHVIVEEIEKSLQEAVKKSNAIVNEFTVAPVINPTKGKSHHQWLIEFERVPNDLNAFAHSIDLVLRKQNSYYDDLIKGSIIAPLKIKILPKNSFRNYMKSIGKLGGQNKIQRVSNDRRLADLMFECLNA